jgi:hypothetical protein
MGDSIYHGAGQTVGTPIELMTLEALLERYGSDRQDYDLLKLDCEGAEYAILRLTPAAVLRRFRYLVIEFHSEPPGESVEVVYAALAKRGFASHLGRRSAFRCTDLFAREDVEEK